MRELGKSLQSQTCSVRLTVAGSDTRTEQRFQPSVAKLLKVLGWTPFVEGRLSETGRRPDATSSQYELNRGYSCESPSVATE